MVHLPVEVWESLLLHLSNHELDKLAGVNRLTLNAALNQKYHSVDPFPLWSSSRRIAKFIEHLLQPHIVGRIQEMRISDRSVYRVDPDNIWPPSRPSKIALALPFGIGKKLPHEVHWRTRIQKLAYRLVSRVSLRSLRIESTDAAEIGFFFPNLLARLCQIDYSAFQPRTAMIATATLRHLDIAMGSCGHSQVIKLSRAPSSTLALLESITIKLEPCDYKRCGTEGTMEMLAFLRKATQPSLRALKVTLSRELVCRELLKDLCLSIGATPRLEVLSILIHDRGYRPGDVNFSESALSSLLRRVASTLRELTIFSFTGGENLRDVHFPKLTRLRLYELDSSPNFTHTLWTMNHLFRHTLGNLHSFEIVENDRLLRFSEFRELVKLLTGSDSKAYLSKLSLNLISISPHVFDLLALHLPTLTDLYLRCVVVLAEPGDEIHQSSSLSGERSDDPFLGQERQTSAAFINHFQDRACDEWMLREVTVQVRGNNSKQLAVQKLLKVSLAPIGIKPTK